MLHSDLPSSSNPRKQLDALLGAQIRQANKQAAELAAMQIAPLLLPTDPTNNGIPSDKDMNKAASDKRRASGKIENLEVRDLRHGDKFMLDNGGKDNGPQLGVINITPTSSHLVWESRQTWEFAPEDKTKLFRYFGSSISIVSLVGVAAVGKPSVSFDSVILEESKKNQIIEAISQVDNHHLIFNDWGFGEVFEKGTAISLLFYGPPGTGKTLMAQAIADRYGKKLKVMSTAEIQTPEPGGAERNIRDAFEAAEKDNEVLLFDECDSLITDRSRVGMILAAQINALLTALEHYTGIVVFTTNRLEALDPAFERRLSLKLEFEMPDAEHRALIWQRMFPKKAPLAKDIRWDDLAQIEIAGGHIKNVVIKAARKAASQDVPKKQKVITDEILWECLEKEIESMESYQEAIGNYNPWYGTPMAGGVGTGVGITRNPGSLALVPNKALK